MLVVPIVLRGKRAARFENLALSRRRAQWIVGIALGARWEIAHFGNLATGLV